MRLKLPALEVVADGDIEVRDADATAKFRMAECAVSRRQAPIRRGPQPRSGPIEEAVNCRQVGFAVPPDSSHGC